MRILAIYLSIGFVVYLILALMLIRTGIDRKGLTRTWWGWMLSGELVGAVLGLLFWPVVAAFSLSRWRAEILRSDAERADSVEKPIEHERSSSYFPRRLDERLAERKSAASKSSRERETNGNAV
jgi:hypothetical protein